MADLTSALNAPSGLDASNAAIALQACMKLTAALETPSMAIAQQRSMVHSTQLIHPYPSRPSTQYSSRESILTSMSKQPSALSCTKIAIDLGLFDILTRNKDKPTTAAELSETCGAESLLIG